MRLSVNLNNQNAEWLSSILKENNVTATAVTNAALHMLKELQRIGVITPPGELKCKSYGVILDSPS